MTVFRNSDKSNAVVGQTSIRDVRPPTVCRIELRRVGREQLGNNPPVSRKIVGDRLRYVYADWIPDYSDWISYPLIKKKKTEEGSNGLSTKIRIVRRQLKNEINLLAPNCASALVRGL